MTNTQPMGSMTSISWPMAREASTRRAVECSLALRDNSAMRTARCYHGRRACTIEKMRAWLLATATLLTICAGSARAQTCHANGGVTLWLDFEGAGVVQ